MDDQEQASVGVRRTVIRTVAVLVGMFGFAFALVPLYDVFCQITGINGKVDATAQSIVHEEVDESRYINVQFITRGSPGLPWQMSVEMRQMSVHPGQMAEVDFTFTNNSPSESWGRAVPSVSPSTATTHLRKISCFCFQEQHLQGDERLTIPLVFQLSRDLPTDINTITLVYTLYPVEHTIQSASLDNMLNHSSKNSSKNSTKSDLQIYLKNDPKNNKAAGEAI
ncbi:cytochrome c oxidase assembly protein [Halomonas sp. FeN2]|jgi:cytochrome c oxidase assembly protein subunit 11|uniref:Cytochrome c oxidase assembly protein CtaG n=1 Tax=Vreelandella neptunia TaxID=115551 RepID=A0ABZ0YS01_9GAMM|nr:MULTISPECIES: cytochrome c oxidase assembly protein [Halomonas]TDV92967.1 cytochrome c oxidase assembly protein subunit 11 [Halomonas alkaliantarctica]MBF58448.1 cytochrome c oxidase assembly protein [Halomonas sp.]MBL1268836.1 cytochrome c oxidase assembly protein [Halomonas sp.]MDN3562273.1 cytochrome c oxidase assembly protein [Halomonas neptunia]UBR49952.1 cytochrome c oxidase assembly protein [Halomonas sp. FeN2]|tara:strand:+ start:202 stop:873 length:672 start_codon:yes stop_codon:yes gene_type:complete